MNLLTNRRFYWELFSELCRLNKGPVVFDGRNNSRIESEIHTWFEEHERDLCLNDLVIEDINFYRGMIELMDSGFLTYVTRPGYIICTIDVPQIDRLGTDERLKLAALPKIVPLLYDKIGEYLSPN